MSPQPNRFPLGQIAATLGALSLFGRLGLAPSTYLNRHAQGDWGDLCAEARQANENALHTQGRLMSVYTLTESYRIWIITEADRSVTTLLLPEEY